MTPADTSIGAPAGARRSPTAESPPAGRCAATKFATRSATRSSARSCRSAAACENPYSAQPSPRDQVLRFDSPWWVPIDSNATAPAIEVHRLGCRSVRTYQQPCDHVRLVRGEPSVRASPGHTARPRQDLDVHHAVDDRVRLRAARVRRDRAGPGVARRQREQLIRRPQHAALEPQHRSPATRWIALGTALSMRPETIPRT